jgi:hypothetical protein
MQTAVGVDREVASAPTLCRLEKWADRATAWRLHQVLVEQFIASFKRAPEELVLDFDATDNPLHRQQEGRFFHGYYDSYFQSSHLSRACRFLRWTASTG